MDESQPSIPPIEFGLRPASNWKSAVVDASPADLARSDKRVAPARQLDSDQSELRRDDVPDGSSVAVYYRNEQEVSRGFLIALSVMGIARIEQLPEPAKPPIRGEKP
jgi:hypothetical protein